MLNKYFLLLITCSLFSISYAQEMIKIKNPSFEVETRYGSRVYNFQNLEGWSDCGFSGESPPDLASAQIGPYEGDTYLLMVIRDNDTWEAIGQELAGPLKKNNTYTFSVQLALLERLEAKSRTTKEYVSFVQPAILRIYGGTLACQRDQLLAQTVAIDHYDWFEYEFVFRPEKDVEHLLIEAYYADPEAQPYNGNLILDYCSDIFLLRESIGYDEADLIAMQDSTFKKTLLAYGKKHFANWQDPNFFPVNSILYYQAWAFEQEIKKSGVRQYIVNTPKSMLSTRIRMLENIGAQETLELFRKLAFIYFKDKEEVTVGESEFFEESDELFLKTMQEENFEGLRKIFLEKHKDEIIQELLQI